MNKDKEEKSKFIGYQFIMKRTDKGILKEVWQDVGDNNQWIKINSWVDNKK